MSDSGYCPKCQKELAAFAGKCVLCSTPVEVRQPGGAAGAVGWLKARPWALMAPPWLGLLLFALVSKAAWVPVPVMSRGGRYMGTTTPAANGLAILVVTTVLYFLLPMLTPGRAHLRTVSEADRGCATAFVRVGALVLQYLAIGFLVLHG